MFKCNAETIPISGFELNASSPCSDSWGNRRLYVGRPLQIRQPAVIHIPLPIRPLGREVLYLELGHRLIGLRSAARRDREHVVYGRYGPIAVITTAKSGD